MTYVRVRLALDSMKPGEVLLVTLQGEEPLKNVPHTAREQGHEILATQAEVNGTHLVSIRKR